ncbi:MAG: glycosyltransferase family 4 protein [Bacteroidetes bacterium]|nr:glycosyltransferase family 4 protein [Bacteroidota bacterium]
MTILELNFEKGWRGGERQTFYTLQGLKDVGVDAHLVCRKDSYLEKYAQREGFTVYSFHSILGVISYLLRKGKRYNFIHTQTSHLLTYCILTKPVVRVPVLFTRRVDFMPNGFFTKLKYKATDKIIAVSEAIKDVLYKFCGRADIEVISDIGVKKSSDIDLAKKRLNGLLLDNKHIIATTAALTPHKDPFTTVEAIKKLSANRKDFIFLHFGSGELKGSIEAAIIKNNLQEFYKLMGFEENVEIFFPLFEAFVMTSQEEGLGSSVLDAFLHQVPVVSTNAGGLKELVGNDRGVLCNVKDSNSIAEGIDLLLNDLAVKQKYIARAFEYANQYHSMKFIIGKYLYLMQNYAIKK